VVRLAGAPSRGLASALLLTDGMFQLSNAKTGLPHWVGLAALVFLGGCYVEAGAPRPPPRCAEAVWVHGHHDRYGDWHPGHYRCRGPRVLVVGAR
jgi:hypothetical protein